MSNLAAFIIRRLLAIVVISLAIATMVFFMVHASPYDPIRILLGQHATTQNIHALDVKFGLTGSVWQQYETYIWRLAHFNLGISVGNGTAGQ
jgi:peptide/nickel transport system permease protein